MPSDEQQIRRLVETWMTATKAGDTWTVPSLVTDDVILLVAGHTLSILRKQDCKWLLARDANMLAPQK